MPHLRSGASFGWRALMLTVSLICIEAIPFRNAARGSGKFRLVDLSTSSMSRTSLSAARPPSLLKFALPPRRASGSSTRDAPAP